MQIGFVTALQPFGTNGPPQAVRRADEPGQPPAEKRQGDAAERERANDRAAGPGPGGASRAGLVRGAEAIVAQESQASSSDQDANGLTEEERRVVAELKKRDAEVRAHEAAHKAAAGAYGGAVSFTFQQGPDGRRYAVGGEVPIDVSTVPGDPQATVRKMQQIRRAATAPAEPSGADRAVAAAATKAMLEAQSDIAAERAAKIASDGEAEASGPQDNRAETGATESAGRPDAPRNEAFEPSLPPGLENTAPAGPDVQKADRIDGGAAQDATEAERTNFSATNPPYGAIGGDPRPQIGESLSIFA